MNYDVIVIGGGPAGLSAALYASRGMVKTLVLENSAIGGQITTTNVVENYPGAVDGITGPVLADRMKEQCDSFGVEFKTEVFKTFEKTGDGFKVITDREEYGAKAIIVATGAQPRKLGCPGEDEHRGMGVSYCATCDANFFRNMHIAVVGGGDTAIEEALYLTKFASKVSVIHRRDALRATKVLADRAMASDKIELIWDSVVEEVTGDGLVNGMRLKNVKTGEKQFLPVKGVFMFVGQEPITEPFVGKLELDDRGYLITDVDMHTDVPGVFAAGDVRKKSLRQAITAAGDGAIAGVQAIKYIENLEA